MNTFQFIAWISFLTEITLGVYLISQHRKNSVAYIWGLLCLSSSTFHIGLIIFSNTNILNKAVTGWQIANLGAILGPIIHHHFVCNYLNLRKSGQIIFLYALAIVLILVNIMYPMYFLGSLVLAFDTMYYTNRHTASHLYTFMYVFEYWFLLLYSFILLVGAYKKSESDSRRQLKYVIIGSSIGWLGAHSYFIPYINSEIYPYGGFLLGIFPVIISYAILRFRILNIHLIIHNSLIYSLSISIVFITFVTIVLLLEKLSQLMLGYKSMYSSFFAAISIAVAFNPLKNYIQHFIDLRILKKSPIEIAKENQLLLYEASEKEKFKAIATLASGMAHEIKNPLTAIKTFNEYLPKRHMDREFILKFSEITRKEINRINDLVNQLIDYGKPTPPEYSLVDINGLVQNCLDILSSQLIKHKITYSFEADTAEFLSIYADRKLLHQALFNLILNSIDAMPSGGSLDIKLRTIQNQYAQVTLTDTGNGIPKEDLSNIFNPFFTKKDFGTGLGLAIVKSIIESHQGYISVQSQVNMGTTFLLKLPLDAPNQDI